MTKWFLKCTILYLELNDIGTIPTSRVTHTLNEELKGRANIYGYIVSGYPRNMRDVADYLAKVRYGLKDHFALDIVKNIVFKISSVN